MKIFSKKEPHKKYPQILEWREGDELITGELFVCVTDDHTVIKKNSDSGRLSTCSLRSCFDLRDDINGAWYNQSWYQRKLNKKINDDKYKDFLKECSKLYQEMIQEC